MPWSDHSDDDGEKAGGAKAGGAKPGATKPSPKPGAKPGPWGGPPPPPGPVAGSDSGSDSARKPEREAPRKPSGGPARKPPNPPTADDLTIMLRRLRQRVTTEIATLQSSGAPPRIAAAVVGAAAALWISTGYYQVKTGERGVVTTFGAYSRTTSEGPNYHLPAPIERVKLVSTSALQVMDIGAAGADDPSSLMLTNDGNIVSVSAAVQYRITDAKKFLFDVTDPSDAIHTIAESALGAAVGRATYAQVLVSGHAAIQNQARASMQAALDRYGAGVSVVGVQIVAAGPPKEVAPDSQAVAAARQSVQASLNDAAGAAAKAVNEARSAAARMHAEAEAYSIKTVGDAQGETSRFSQIDAEYRQAPAVTKQRLYTETMEHILAHANKVIVDARGAATPLVLPSDAFRSRGPTVEAVAPGGVQ